LIKDVETGRHLNIERNKRLCINCNLDVEEKIRFVLICRKYTDIKSYYIRQPST